MKRLFSIHGRRRALSLFLSFFLAKEESTHGSAPLRNGDFLQRYGWVDSGEKNEEERRLSVTLLLDLREVDRRGFNEKRPQVSRNKLRQR